MCVRATDSITVGINLLPMFLPKEFRLVLVLLPITIDPPEPSSHSSSTNNVKSLRILGSATPQF